MGNPPSQNWAKLISLNPYKQDIHFPSQPNEPKKYIINSQWMIYQELSGNIWIANLSMSQIQVEDELLDKDEEVKISNGDKISFHKHQENDSFDYVFYSMNLPQKNPLKRNREEGLEPAVTPPSPRTQKFPKITGAFHKELTCSICMEIFQRCVTLDPCQHNFCSSCLLNHLKRSTNCPLCRTIGLAIRKNYTLHNLAELASKGSQNKERREYDPMDLRGNIMKNEQETFIGFEKNGLKEGKGHLIYADGRVFEGAWINDKREGKGNLICQHGNIFKGQWLNDILQSIDEIVFPNYGIYKGQTKEFERDGKGTFEYWDGSHYEGYYKDDKREGFGIYSWKSGAEYVGDWAKGYREGSGMMRYDNGSIYKGQWKNSVREGKGLMIYNFGDQYDGSWANDCRNGRGKYIWRSGAEYEGDWSENARNGNGSIKYSDGRIYNGNWKDSKKHGNGTLTLSNGDQYEGNWVNDDLQPLVKIKYANGEIYEGEIDVESLEKHGKGVLTFKNGEQSDGYWINEKQQDNKKEICRDDHEGNFLGNILVHILRYVNKIYRRKLFS